MLKNLNLNYFYWTLITISSSISTIIFMPIWGKISDKFGNLRVLKVTGALIPFVPFLWFFSVFINSSRPEFYCIIFSCRIFFRNSLGRF
jgi:MFS family permease